MCRFLPYNNIYNCGPNDVRRLVSQKSPCQAVCGLQAACCILFRIMNVVVGVNGSIAPEKGNRRWCIIAVLTTSWKGIIFAFREFTKVTHLKRLFFSWPFLSFLSFSHSQALHLLHLHPTWNLNSRTHLSLLLLHHCLCLPPLCWWKNHQVMKRLWSNNQSPLRWEWPLSPKLGACAAALLQVEHMLDCLKFGVILLVCQIVGVYPGHHGDTMGMQWLRG